MDELSPSEEPEIKRVQPFKLCFVTKREIGRSNVTIGKPLILAPIITPKFYVENKYYPDGDFKAKISQLTVTGPKDKLNYPQTENQRYGWYECDKLNESKLNFKIMASQFVKDHLMIYEKIRQ